MSSTSDYFLGGASPEQERLLRQGEELRWVAEQLIDSIPVQPGWKAVDVGCGPLAIMDILAERVGPTGEVIGIEREPETAATCAQQLAARQLTNARGVTTDARDACLAPETFDLVHARLLLINMPDPAPFVETMVELARPGAWVALEDVDADTFVCDPPHPAWDTLRRWDENLLRRRHRRT